MTLEEKRNRIIEYCEGRKGCIAHDSFKECPLATLEATCYYDDSVIDKHYEILFGKEEEPKESNDVINHPKHYCREGGMESIEEMVLVFGKEAVKNFCLCNVWKYRYRSSSKNGEEDLHKSDWYMQKYKELCEDDEPRQITFF